MSFCEGFDTIDLAMEGYPNRYCDKCPNNEFDHDSGIATCERIMYESMKEVHVNENKEG